MQLDLAGWKELVTLSGSGGVKTICKRVQQDTLEIGHGVG